MAPSEEITKKNVARGHIKGALTRLKTFTCEEIKGASLELLIRKRERLVESFKQYEEICKIILYLNPNDSEDFVSMEDEYFQTLSIFDKEINTKSEIKPQPSTSATTTKKLPSISIKTFDGKFTEYIPFRNLFTSMIHKDVGLDSVQKLYYLRSFLTNEPLDIIKNLPITSKSYEEALNLLDNRYNNRYRITSEHITNILDLKPIIKSSAHNLRTFLSDVNQQLAAIKNHEPKVEQWDTILLCILTRKLDSYTARAYQLERDLDEEPKLNDLLKFLEKRAVAMENTEQGSHNQQTSKGFEGNKKVTAHAVMGAACSYCKYKNHKLFQCKKFQMLPTGDRLKFITENKMCQVCLSAHAGRCRYHFRCGECKEMHNTLLHTDTATLSPQPTVTLAGNADNNVLLPTARIKLIGLDGTEYQIKALLDTGSQVSFVSSKVVELLGLKSKKSNLNIIGIGNSKSNVKACISLQIYSLKSSFQTAITCHIVDTISCLLPQNKINISNFIIPPDISLADEKFYEPGEINMLIGSDVFFQSLLPTSKPMQLELTIPSSTGLATASCASLPRLYVIGTVFGSIVAGNIPAHLIKPTCNRVVLKCESSISISKSQSISETLSQFWTNEKVPEIFNEKTSEQELCEQIFQNTVILNENRFQVTIPLKLPLTQVNNTLGESFHFALRRFLNLEKKLHASPELFKQYQNFIHEYLSLNHGHYIDIEEYNSNKNAVYFLAHHAIMSKNSKTTKLRTVFDGSMRGSNKVSLNDLQLNGPVVQRDLFDIILLFRLGKYTFTADIRRMFRNIRVDPEFTSLQNILWRDHPNESVKCIRLDTVTYGLKSSSFLATRCLDELAKRFENSYPLASSVVRNNTYIDDVIYSNNDLSTVLAAKNQLQDLLNLGSFNTHKWSSNNEQVLSDIPLDQQHFDSLDLQRDDFNMLALGLQINIKDDHFIISAPEPFISQNITKRSILSYIGRIYDPIGFVSPLVVTAKVIMQKLWVSKVNWNEKPPAEVANEWLQFTADLSNMKPILLPRNIDFSDTQTAQLIGFADASRTTAYGCCVYLRLINQSGTKADSYLLCSKSRINPIQKKGMTVPRLELNAALLLSKLVAKTYDVLTLKINIENVYLFSDSQIVLAWLNTEITKLQAYVGNRVNVIQQITTRWRWLYVSTTQNPADMISRGVSPSELRDKELWWKGPCFLQDSKYDFVSCQLTIPADIPEVKPCSVFYNSVVCQHPLEYIFERLYNCSDINKIVRLFAYILRFLNNLNNKKEKINTKFLCTSELNQSLMLIIKYEQDKYLYTEIESLRKGNHLKGNLAKLHPFIDELGLLRVGGRLHHATIAYSHKHPVILPKGSIITNLLIRREHERLLHAGPRLTLSNLNQRFWIVNGLLEVKKVTHRCVTCFRNKATVAKQLMGSLPAGRVTVTSRPFEKIGVDFAGPIQVKLSRIRRSVIGKGYILVCVCFATKAVHLELASDLTTETFLACIRRLISRRGLPREIHCDNASTFKCARSQLAELYSLQSSQNHQAKVYEFSSQRGIDFHFIPCYSPTFGTLWETSVKSMKFYLKRILYNNTLTYEQLSTVLTEIEAVLNSRPLLPLSSDPNDFCYLTPGHFIIGSSLTMYPERDVSDVPQNRLRFWQLCTHLKQSFWKQWHKHYLNTLQHRPKWLNEENNVKIGTLVILKEDNLPSMSWPMARIVKVFPGHEGKVRAVEVMTPNNKTHLRGIHKICVLPIPDND